MKLKAVSGIMLTLLLIATLMLTFNIQPVKAHPPTIGTPSQEPKPDNVMPTDTVMVSVSATDTIGGVRNVILAYTENSGTTWSELTMVNVTTVLWQGIIPAFPSGVWIWYKIVAYDNAGNLAVNDNAGEYYVYGVNPPIGNLAEETISNYIRGRNLDGTRTFGWTSGYDISFVSLTLHIEINIQLVGDDPGDALRQQWEDGIEGMWSNAYDIVDGTYTYPIMVEVNWVTADPHHVVNVHAGGGRHNMENWYTQTIWEQGNDVQDEIAAHEAGHMLGLYDEYLPDGALDPDTLFTTTNSLMADLGPTRSWHYEQILEWLETRSDRDLSSAQSPLPPYALDDPIPDFSDPFPLPRPPVGGKATSINIPINKPESQTPWIWLATIILSLVLTLVYIKKRKRESK